MSTQPKSTPFDPAMKIARLTVRALPRKLVSGLAVAALLLALVGTPQIAYAAAIAVNGDGTGITCSLSAAITNANNDNQSGSTHCASGSGADTITLSVDVTLTAALPAITSDIAIVGGGHTISGNSTFRILNITAGTVSINQAIISGGGGVTTGGGINNAGALTVQNSTISNNTATSDGGGIWNSGTLVVQSSTLSGNTATSGGGLFNAAGGNMTVNNSTLSDNTAESGGGIWNTAGSTLTVVFSTIHLNKANDGGGIWNDGTTTVRNSIVAGNIIGTGSTVIPGSTVLPPDDCAGTVLITSLGYNIESGSSCNFIALTDMQTIGSGSLDLLNLQPLATDTLEHPATHALASPSVAIDAIPNGINGCVAGTSVDERGGVRADGVGRGGSACDIGAFEYDSNQTPLAVTLLDLTATANTAPGVIGAVGAALASLGALWVGRRRLKR
jgi:hypothetical protein